MTATILPFVRADKARGTAKVLQHARPTSLRAIKHLNRSLMPISPRHVYYVDARGLSPVAVQIYRRPLTRIWVDGSIIDDPVHPARAAGTTPARWRKRADELAPFFDRLADGAWVDMPLVASRAKVLKRFEQAEQLRRRIIVQSEGK